MASTPSSGSRDAALRTLESPVDLHHPTPDLQSLQGAYVGNVERLEDHAERMSEHGSDLGEEIRKLQLEQKLSGSRNSSLRSPPPLEDPQPQYGVRSRNASTSSYTNSIVDVNGNARWGGYSPGGYVTSPVGSLRSAASFSHQTPLQRQRSGSKASRLGQIVHAEEYDDEHFADAQPSGSPRSHFSSPRAARRNSSPPASHRSVSSFTKKYDQIAQEIQEEIALGHSPTHTEHMPENHGHQHDDRHLPDRPPTAASTDTTHQARTLWHDFDGTHCPDTVIEEEPTPTHDSADRDSFLMESALEAPSQGVPPPEDGMVFYPAPVPQMLNLPKRLSKLPAANVQARRRTQLLESMQSENRKSAPWLSEAGPDVSKSNRRSRHDLAKLPPQLRASAYFDQAAPTQEFEVKGESAEATLDSILAASAHAPVSAFTDHPFAGHVGNEVYGREKHTRTKSKANDIDEIDTKKNRRSSFNLLDTNRNSSGDPLNKLKKRNSSADLNMLTVRASESRMSLGGELDQPEPEHEARGPNADGEATPTRRSSDAGSYQHQEEEEGEGGEAEGEEEEEEHQYFGAPTTLLAELEMRKNQQKKRNLTAATAFPQGMHATLLQLDAVAEVNKNKRKTQKVNLAWEAVPLKDEDESSDDDVPLGVLYPERNGLINQKKNAGPRHTTDWDRPLGLIAQREMEDQEPLSRRRTRLLGVEPNRSRDHSPGKGHPSMGDRSVSQHLLTVPTSGSPQLESEEEGEGETLAQRIRRLKNRQTLDNALGEDVRKSTVSGDFAAEMLNQIGVPEESKPNPSPSPGIDEEETLGQRRARLQAEALARGDTNPLGSRPPLRASMSMANILSAHPIDNTNQAHKVSDEQLLNSLPQGSLLHQNAMEKSRKEADRLNLNKRISSFNLSQPLLGEGMGKAAPEQAVAGKIQAYKDMLASAGAPQTAPLPTMMYPMGGMNMSAMNLPGPRDSFFPPVNMQMGMSGMPNMPQNFVYPGANMMQQPMMGMGPGMMAMPNNGMHGMGNPYGQMGGMRQSSMMNLTNPMQMQQSMMMMEPPMDPRQRDMIDRWRNGVA